MATEVYSIAVVVQSASGTYTKTLTFESQADAEKAKQQLIKLAEKL